MGVGQLEGGKPATKPAPAKPAPAKPAPADKEDDDVDLFGSSDEEESEEKKRITEERLKAYHEKRPRSLRSSPIPRISSMSNPGTTRQTMTRCLPPSRALRWTDFCGAPTSSSPSATASRSCK